MLSNKWFYHYSLDLMIGYMYFVEIIHFKIWKEEMTFEKISFPPTSNFILWNAMIFQSSKWQMRQNVKADSSWTEICGLCVNDNSLSFLKLYKLLDFEI